MISAETTLPSAVPLRFTTPLKWPKRCRPSAVGRARGRGGSDGLALRDQPCRGRQQALSGFICQLSWSITQPAYIANRGTSGIATSMAIEGSVQFPDWKRVGLGRGPRRGRGAEGSLQPEAEGLHIDRHHHLAIGGDGVLDRGQRDRGRSPEVRCSAEGCSAPSVVRAKGISR